MKSLLVVSMLLALGIFAAVAFQQVEQVAATAGEAASLDAIPVKILQDQTPNLDPTITEKVKKEVSCTEQRAQEERNKELVLALYQGVFGDHDVAAVDKYIHPTRYIQHNPAVPDGPGPVKEFIQVWNAGKPREKVDVKRVAAGGDLVWLHVKSRMADGKYLAIVEIFRVEDGKVVEHWDVIQPVPELSESKNPHPLF